jgi:hypothetical protein
MAGVGRRGFAAAAMMADTGYGGRPGGMEPPVSSGRRDYQTPQMESSWGGVGMGYSREGSLEPPRNRNLNDDFGRGHSPVPPRRIPTLDIDTSRNGGFSRGVSNFFFLKNCFSFEFKKNLLLRWHACTLSVSIFQLTIPAFSSFPRVRQLRVAPFLTVHQPPTRLREAPSQARRHESSQTPHWRRSQTAFIATDVRLGIHA